MAEIFELISTGSTGVTASTSSAIFDTRGKRNFALYVTSKDPVGSGSDTFDGTLEECDNTDFTAANNDVYTIRMTKPDGTAASAIDQILGNDTGATLTQKFNLPDTNYSRYIRFNHSTAGTATDFTNLKIFISADQIKRTTIS